MDSSTLNSRDADSILPTLSSSSTEDSALNDYLLSLLPLLLSASQVDIRRSFLDPSNTALIARFANEQQVQSVYINKIREQRQQSSSTLPSTPAADALDAEDRAHAQATITTTRFIYTVTSTLSWHPDNVASLALIKRVPTIDSTRSIAEQIHVLNLFGPALTAATSSTSPSNDSKAVTLVDDDDGQAMSRASAASSANPYGSLHSIVHLAVQPYFEAYISRKATSADEDQDSTARDLPTSSSGNALSSKSGGPLSAVTASAASNANKKSKDNDLSSNTGIPIAKKKFAELELSLLHLQQNVEIPETVLGVHPVVMKAVEQVSRQTARQLTPDRLY